MKSSYKIDKLGNYIEQIRGVSYKPNDVSEEQKEGYKVILRANSIKDSKLILNDLIYVKDELIKEKQFIKNNDILMAASSGSKEIVGKSVQIKSDTEYTFGAFCKLIRCKENINPNYVAYFLRTPYYRSTISAVVNGANINNLKNEHIDNLDIPLPNLETQKKIAEVLDKAQELIDKRKEQIEALDELLKSRFIDMFGDPNLNPKGWPKTSWEYIFNTTTGKLDSNAMVEGGIYPFFTCAKERFWIDKYDFDCEALLLAGNNAAGIYDVKYYNGKFNAYQRTYVLTLINNEYSYVVFKHQLENKLSLLRHQSKGSNTRYLTMGILKELEFIIPPIELQNQFADFVSQVEKLKSQMETNLKELEDNFNSLMQKAFKGELF